MDKNKLRGNFFLLITSLIWGSAFVAQRVGMDYVGPFTFTAVRFWLAVAALFPVMLFLNKKELLDKPAETDRDGKKTLLVGGLTCGFVLFIASVLQQFGLVFTTAGKAGFITALYIVLVPLLGLFLKHRPGAKSWLGVLMGTIGLYFLTITESFTIARGDFIVLVGAFFWASHVLVIDHFTPYVDGVKLSIIQFIVCGVLGTVAMFIFERPSMGAIFSAAIPILYAGVMSAGVGFTFQILGQRHTSPTVASLILSLESVFSAVFGFLLLHEIMSPRELLGCALLFVAVIISQLPDRAKA